jgi:hypothetical protein
MARFTLSVSDNVAAALDAYAAGNELNRSQAAEKIFRSFLSPGSGGGGDGEERGEQAAGDLAYLSNQVLEVQEYLTILIANHQTLRDLVITTTDLEGIDYNRQPRMLPEPPWVRRSRGY